MDNNPQSTVPDGSQKKFNFDDLPREDLINKCKGFLAIAQKAKQARSELLNQVDSFKLQLDNCESEKRASQENVKTLQELVDSLTEQKLNYITEIDSAQSTINFLNSKVETNHVENQKNKDELSLKDKQIADISHRLFDLNNETISLKRQNNRLLEENEQLINQLTELESRAAEFNNIGLQQREQLEILELKVQSDDSYKTKIEDLNKKIEELESKLETSSSSDANNDYEVKIKELTELYESEKDKKEKANIKLRSYKDKILKCAACINQLKNSRFILSKTVKEYSENIPKWQNDILKASKVLEEQVNQLNKDNSVLQHRISLLEDQLSHSVSEKVTCEEHVSQIGMLSNENDLLKKRNTTIDNQLQECLNNQLSLDEELTQLKSKFQLLNEEKIAQLTDNELLKSEIQKITVQLNNVSRENGALLKQINEIEAANNELKSYSENKSHEMNVIENLNLQIKALESEKAILVKEKLNARENILELDNEKKILTEHLTQSRSDCQTIKTQLESITQEKHVLQENYKKQRNEELNQLKSNLIALQSQYDVIKKEYDDQVDLNGLLKEEVETLKLSLEQPADETGNLSNINESLQADIVKLETKLSAYKLENASLLTEVKESRVKIAEYDSVVTELEETKSKLVGYKTENTELLHEMKEINQALKERGEAISKLQKVIGEMERLIETLEKDRDLVKQEKEDLTKKVGTLEKDLRNVTNKTNENTEANKQVLSERDNAVRLVAEKDTQIASLKDEIEKLRQSTTDLPNEDMSTSTISKAEDHSRMKDLDETFEEKYTKLRIFALKLKKKLNETTAQLQNSEQDKAKLEKMIQDHQFVQNKEVVLQDIDQVDSGEIKEDINKVSELETKVQSLSIAMENSKTLEVELEQIKAELSSMSKELASEVEAHKVTKESLEKAKRDVKKKSVLSLEMEDYERSMKELTAKMEENKKKMIQMESTIDTQEGTITAMKTQIKLLEEQIKAEETQNRIIKEELQHSIEEAKEKDNVIQVKNGIISQLEQDLEDEKRKNEESDLEMTSLISDKEKVIMNLGAEKVELNNKLKRLEFKYAELNEKLKITNIELADLKTEHTSYKVRAQAVLRQNQNVDHSQEEQLKEETAALKTQVDTLTSKLNTAQEQCSEAVSEAAAMQRRAADATAEAARAAQRTARLQADLARLALQLDNERNHHQLQVSTLTQCYKTQLSDLESKLQTETEALRKQLVAAQEHAKVVKVRLDDANQNQYMLPVIPKDDGSDGEMDINVSMIPREEGEGSESSPTPPLKPYASAGGARRSPVSLERLLEEGVPEDEALDAASLALTSDQEIADLRRKLQAQQQRVVHVTVLLSESERECARMAQLAELLKAELRRVRGAAAEHNTEYMKNVTFKFLTLPPGDERGRLVPVLQKILTLTPEETQKIQALAKGQDPNPGKGWGTYLPWPGGK